MFYEDSVILLYAKAPVAGKVNTRLIADIGVQAATELQHELIHDRLTMLTESALCDVRLMCAPDTGHDCFTRCDEKYPVALFDQSGDDLGMRMYNGIRDALQDYKHCVVIGTDAPVLDAVKIRQVLEKLHSGSEVVIVPAEDGGYVLIAMQQAHECLFQEVSWGSAEVMRQTARKLDEKNILYEQLAPCWDIDRLEDYRRYLDLAQDHTELSNR